MSKTPGTFDLNESKQRMHEYTEKNREQITKNLSSEAPEVEDGVMAGPTKRPSSMFSLADD